MQTPTIPGAFTAAPAQADAARSYVVPLVVAVTGHRDLKPTEVPAIQARVRTCLIGLRNDYPGRLVAVMSALADGADRLVAQLALELRMPLTVVLPMPRALYAADFDPDSLAEFERLCGAAADVFELPLAPGATAASVGEQGHPRSVQYAAVGV